jgi:hypothetical protein
LNVIVRRVIGRAGGIDSDALMSAIVLRMVFGGVF